MKSEFSVLCRLYHRITDMKDGTFCPEVFTDSGKGSDMWFGEPVATIREASQCARSVCEEIARAWLAGRCAQLADDPQLANYSQLVLLAVA